MNFTEGFDKLSNIGFAISIFGSARFEPENPWYGKAETLSRKLSENNFSIIIAGGADIMKAGNKVGLQK
ncbi:MAG: hypothetical protein OQK73_12315 [Gammaproteobacteria bacterium]|nr:hypothetical protein [Gammaproteobacteria bacterium]